MQTFYLTDADAKVAVNLLRTILNTRQVFVNEKLNALVVRETPEKIELARKVLEANDRSVGEVEIDMEVLEVDRTAAQNLGLDFSPRTLSVTLEFPPSHSRGKFRGVTSGRGSTVSITSPTLIMNLDQERLDHQGAGEPDRPDPRPAEGAPAHRPAPAVPDLLDQ